MDICNTMSRKLPIGIQSFEKLRTGGYLYVDKTELVYRLAKAGIPCFLSRPRRFGKSLLLSTLEAYFLGKKDLFKGLAIERLEQDWLVYRCCTWISMQRNMTVTSAWPICSKASLKRGRRNTG